jgi:hypothetical protein
MSLLHVHIPNKFIDESKEFNFKTINDKCKLFKLRINKLFLEQLNMEEIPSDVFCCFNNVNNYVFAIGILKTKTDFYVINPETPIFNDINIDDENVNYGLLVKCQRFLFLHLMKLKTRLFVKDENKRKREQVETLPQKCTKHNEESQNAIIPDDKSFDKYVKTFPKKIIDTVDNDITINENRNTNYRSS